jgi:hypothetical protein
VWVDPDTWADVSFPVSSDAERGELKEVVGRIAYQISSTIVINAGLLVY